MDVTPDPELLRRRAAGLRQLADRLATTPALSLDRYGGPETWSSPRADLCRQLLGANRVQLRHAAEDLLTRARRLERRADEAELTLGVLR